jgi:AAA domain
VAVSARDQLRAYQRGEPTGELCGRPLDTVRLEPVRFLVPERVPLQAVTLLVGDPGLGKSTWTCFVAAAATRGAFGEPTTVAIINAEDSLKSVVGPRLHAAGADLARVEALTVDDGDSERVLVLPGDVPKLEEFVADTTARLLVVDPLGAFLSGDVDSHNDAGVRRALAPLALLAEKHDIAVLVAAHLNKDEQKGVLYRVGGSIGLVGAARSVLLFARDPDDPDGDTGAARLLAHAKSNWGRLAATVRYAVEGASILADDDIIETSRLVEQGESGRTAEDLVGRQRSPSKLEEAKATIVAALVDGPRPSSDVKAEVAVDVECGHATIERAAQDLRRAGKLVATGSTTRMMWSLQLSSSNSPHPPPKNEEGSENPVVEPNSTSLLIGGTGAEESEASGSANGHGDLAAPDWRDRLRDEAPPFGGCADPEGHRARWRPDPLLPGVVSCAVCVPFVGD